MGQGTKLGVLTLDKALVQRTVDLLEQPWEVSMRGSDLRCQAPCVEMGKEAVSRDLE